MSIRSFFVLALSAFGALAVTAAQAQDPRYGGGPGYNDDPGYRNGYAQAVDCKSSGYNMQRCPVPWRDARLVRQYSNTQCIRGQNWGLDARRGFIWVDRGCGGQFVDARGGGHYRPPGAWQPGPGWDHNFTVRCESIGGQSHFCSVDVGGRGRVYLQRQESNSPCDEGQTWGWNRAGVWVAGGCRAIFTIDRRW